MYNDHLEKHIYKLYAIQIIRKIIYFDIINSTNDYLLNDYNGKLEEVILITANYQTHGKGRFSRSWIADRNQSILSSLLLEIPKEANLSDLTLVMAESILEILTSQFNLNASIKKPNDILVSHKKISGILTEIREFNAHSFWTVLGFGINVHQHIKDFPESLKELVTSIFLATHKNVNRADLLYIILEKFQKNYLQWK